MYETLRSLISLPGSNRRVGAALLLLGDSLGLVIQHGSGKLMQSVGVCRDFGIPIWLALATMLVQLSGGTLLILGVLTPLAAWVLQARAHRDDLLHYSRRAFIDTVGHGSGKFRFLY